MRHVLALDAGGSKCDVLFAREDGTVLGYGHVGADSASNGRTFVGFGRDPRSIQRAIAQALGETRCNELDLTGFATSIPLRIFNEEQFPVIRLHRIHEYEPAFTLLNEPAGIAVVAGTGAFVHCRTRDGRELHLDGLGPQLGDFGGGYQIGLLGLQAAARAGWHPRHRTSLEERILQAIRPDEQARKHEIFIHFMLAPRDRTDIAWFARIVDEEARAGDRIAIEILHKAADDLAGTIWDAVDRMAMAAADYPLIALGSIALKSEIFWARLCAGVQKFAPRVRFLRPEQPPVAGMALCVLQQIGAADPQALRQALTQTLLPFLPALTPTASMDKMGE